MINNQRDFSITKEKEQELFEYIINECGCQIYRLYRCEEKEVFESNDEILDFAYFIKPKLIHKDVEYQKDENGMRLHPFDEGMNFYPFVLCERYLTEETYTQARLYFSKNIKKEYVPAIKVTYKQISNWIKKNSYKQERNGLFKLYYVE